MSPRGKGESTTRRGAAGAASVSDVSGRIGRRRRRQRLRQGIAGLIVLLLVGLVAAGVWLVGFSSVFAATDVEVTGTTTLSPDLVQRAAAVPVGTPLVRVRPAQIHDRVAALVEVRSVTVGKKYPHTVTIAIQERSAVFVLKTASSERLVDAAGVDFRTAPDPVPKGLVVADLPTGGSQRLYADLATVAQGLPEPLKQGTLTADSRDSITVKLADGRTVVWGSADETPLKAQVATTLLNNVQASVYDVSSPSHPVTR